MSRTYVAICASESFDGNYCRKFSLPEDQVNDNRNAAHFFLTAIDETALLHTVITAEEFGSVIEVSPEDPTGEKAAAAREDRYNKIRLFSDYHKDYYGYRPKMSTWTDDEIVAAFDKITADFDEKRKTPEGRQWLRNRHWHVPEPGEQEAERVEAVFYTLEAFRAALMSGQLSDDDGGAKYKLEDYSESTEWVNLSNVLNGDVPVNTIGINWYSK
jgi:hypothetical protein